MRLSLLLSLLLPFLVAEECPTCGQDAVSIKRVRLKNKSQFGRVSGVELLDFFKFIPGIVDWTPCAQECDEVETCAAFGYRKSLHLCGLAYAYRKTEEEEDEVFADDYRVFVKIKEGTYNDPTDGTEPAKCMSKEKLDTHTLLSNAVYPPHPDDLTSSASTLSSHSDSTDSDTTVLVDAPHHDETTAIDQPEEGGDGSDTTSTSTSSTSTSFTTTTTTAGTSTTTTVPSTKTTTPTTEATSTTTSGPSSTTTSLPSSSSTSTYTSSSATSSSSSSTTTSTAGSSESTTGTDDTTLSTSSTEEEQSTTVSEPAYVLHDETSTSIIESSSASTTEGAESTESTSTTDGETTPSTTRTTTTTAAAERNWYEPVKGREDVWCEDKDENCACGEGKEIRVTSSTGELYTGLWFYKAGSEWFIRGSTYAEAVQINSPVRMSCSISENEKNACVKPALVNAAYTAQGIACNEGMSFRNATASGGSDVVCRDEGVMQCTDAAKGGAYLCQGGDYKLGVVYCDKTEPTTTTTTDPTTSTTTTATTTTTKGTTWIDYLNPTGPFTCSSTECECADGYEMRVSAGITFSESGGRLPNTYNGLVFKTNVTGMFIRGQSNIDQVQVRLPTGFECFKTAREYGKKSDDSGCWAPVIANGEYSASGYACNPNRKFLYAIGANGAKCDELTVGNCVSGSSFKCKGVNFQLVAIYCR